MVVTSERLYSPELKATVMTKHTDPWAVELKTTFTGLSTTEPDSSLFAVPSGYKIVDRKGRWGLQHPATATSPGAMILEGKSLHRNEAQG